MFDKLNVSSSLNLPVVFTNFIEPSRSVNTPERFLKLWARLGKKKFAEDEDDDEEEEEEENEKKNEREIVITRPLAIPIQHVGVYIQGGFHLQPVKVNRISLLFPLQSQGADENALSQSNFCAQVERERDR